MHPVTEGKYVPLACQRDSLHLCSWPHPCGYPGNLTPSALLTLAAGLDLPFSMLLSLPILSAFLQAGWVMSLLIKLNQSTNKHTPQITIDLPFDLQISFNSHSFHFSKLLKMDYCPHPLMWSLQGLCKSTNPIVLSLLTFKTSQILILKHYTQSYTLFIFFLVFATCFTHTYFNVVNMVPCSLWLLSLLTPHSLETLNLLWPWFSSYLSNCFFSTSFAGPSSSTHFRWPLSSFYKLSMNNLIAPIILINTQTAGDSQLLILRPDLPTDLLSSNCLQGSSVSMSNRHLILNTPDTELTIFPLNTLLFLCSSSLHVASSSTCHSPEQTGSRLRALPPPSSTSAPLLSLCVWLRQHSFLGRSEVIFSVLSSNPYYSSDFDQWSNALDSSSKLSLNFFFHS